VADLLECLIQIKGVADTPRRLAQRVADALDTSISRDAAERHARHVTCRLLAVERRCRDGLSSVLSQDRPMMPELVPSSALDDFPASLGDCQAEFAARRAETVRVLESCSADQLNRIGIEPSRGPMTVADLVAVILAHDTDRIGDLVPDAAPPDGGGSHRLDEGDDVGERDLGFDHVSRGKE